MKPRFLIPLLLSAALLLTGCFPATTTPESTIIATVDPAQSATDGGSTAADPSELFSDRDYEVGYDDTESIAILLEGDTATCNGENVQISGSTVTITGEGTYVLSGTLDDGMIFVDTDKTGKLQLVLDNVDIHSQSCAPIYIAQADKVFITTTADSVNTLSGGDSFTPIDDHNIDAVIYAQNDVTLNGSGTLIVDSPAGHGIVSKDSLTITSGAYQISSASHALSGKDDVSISSGTFALTAGKDGIHAENADDPEEGFVHITGGVYTITSEGDGISAGSYLQIEDGSFQITAGGGSVNGTKETSDNWGGSMGGAGGGHPGGMGGRPGDMGGFSQESDAETTDSTSMKGLRAAAALTLNGGSFTIDTADDGIHSNGYVTINGGSFCIATGDDGIHADDTLTLADGTLQITESYEGLEAQHILIAGGDTVLHASDDGLNAAGGNDSSGSAGDRDGMFGGGPGMEGGTDGTITISGGTLHITASGDGIDANGSVEITGGHTTVCGPTRGDTATLDYATAATISGGTFIGTGASGMAQTFSDSQQGVIAVSAGNQSAGTQITLADKDGNTILSCAPALSFNVIILSSPDVQKGETYTLTVGSLSESFCAN